MRHQSQKEKMNKIIIEILSVIGLLFGSIVLFILYFKLENWIKDFVIKLKEKKR